MTTDRHPETDISHLHSTISSAGCKQWRN